MFDDAIVDNAGAASAKEILASEVTGLLGDITVFKFHAHGFHWNVKGPDFKEYHAFFGEIYEDADDTIDTFAEIIRQLGFDAPFLLTDLAALSCYQPANSGSDRRSMSSSLYLANEAVLAHLKDVFDVATECREQGVANFIADRIAKHQFWAWQLGASLSDGTSAQVEAPMDEATEAETTAEEILGL